MQQYLMYIVLVYLAVVFFITNILAKKTVRKYVNSFFMKRRVFIPVGFILVTLLLFLVAYTIPNDAVLFVIGPFICYYVGIVSHITFERVAGYNKLAEEKNPYSKTNRNKNK